LAQARDGRLHILGKLIETLASPKKVLKLTLQIITRRILQCFYWALVGPGGKVIQELQKSTGTTIVINEDQLLKKELLKFRMNKELKQY
jgi:polyribonucleotide nucleotidyltransferase